MAADAPILRSRVRLAPETLSGFAGHEVATRGRSVAGALVVLLAGFALVVVGMRINDARYVATYYSVLGVLAATWSRIAPHVAFLVRAVRRERVLMRVGIVGCAAMFPLFTNDAYQLHMLALAGLFALMAIGLNVTTGFAGLAEFGYVVYYAIGAYTSALLNVKLGLNFWFCLPVAGLVTAAMSMAVAFPAVRVTGHYLALVTLGFAFIVLQLITNLQWLTGGPSGVGGIRPPSMFGHGFDAPIDVGWVHLPYQGNFYYLVLALLCAAVYVCSRLLNSRWGRAWNAMRTDEVAAQANGLNLMQLKLLAFGTGASFGGLAGSVYAHMIGFIDPTTFRFMDSIFLLAIVSIGNWRIGGVVAAGLLFTILPEKLRAFDDWRLLIFGGLLLLIMITRGRRMPGNTH